MSRPPIDPTAEPTIGERKRRLRLIWVRMVTEPCANESRVRRRVNRKPSPDDPSPGWEDVVRAIEDAGGD